MLIVGDVYTYMYLVRILLEYNTIYTPVPPAWFLLICDGFHIRRRRHGIKRSDEEQCQSQLVDVLNIYTENAWRKAHENRK